jgi:hypothetical protein
MELSLVNRDPITPRQHSLIDCGQSAFLIAALALFGLGRLTTKLVSSLGVIHAITNALSDTLVTVYRFIPMPVDGSIEKWGGPAFLALAFLTDGTRTHNARCLPWDRLLAATTYNLPDYNGDPDA